MAKPLRAVRATSATASADEEKKWETFEHKGFQIYPADAPKSLKHDYAYREMQKAAVQWGAVTGSIGIALHFLGMRYSKFYAGPRLTPAIRLFFVSSSVALGGWAGAEDKHMRYVRTQSQYDADQFDKKVVAHNKRPGDWE